jgi:hypothetical protein
MTGTIVITGLMLLATVFLVLWDYHKVSVLFTQESRNEIRVTGLYHEWYQNDFWAWLGFILFLITVIYVLCLDRNPMLWFLICVSIGLIGYIYFNFRKMKS